MSPYPHMAFSVVTRRLSMCGLRLPLAALLSALASWFFFFVFLLTSCNWHVHSCPLFTFLHSFIFEYISSSPSLSFYLFIYFILSCFIYSFAKFLVHKPPLLFVGFIFKGFSQIYIFKSNYNNKIWYHFYFIFLDI